MAILLLSIFNNNNNNNDDDDDGDDDDDDDDDNNNNKNNNNDDDNDDDDGNEDDNNNNNRRRRRRRRRIAFKSAIRDFFQSPHCTANRLQHIRSDGSGAIVCKRHATHRALITCNMSCYMPRGAKGQLSY